jgi:hypothetical protein
MLTVTQTQTTAQARIIAARQAVLAMIPKVQKFWKDLPPSIRFAAPVAVLVAGVLAIYLLWGVGESFVSLQVHHNFKTAELKVSVDGWTKHSTTLNGASSRKIFGSRIVGLYSKQMSIRPGHHEIEIKVTAPGYEQSRTITADLARDSEIVLDVSCTRNGVFASLHQPAPHLYASTSGAIRSNPMTSLMLTMCGSAISAIIGFYIQEFLRTRRKA